MGRLDQLNSYYIEEIQRLAQIGLWHYDMATQNLSVSDSFYDIYEATDIPSFNMDSIWTLYSAEQKALLDAKSFLANTQGLPYDIELMVTTFKGNKRWVRVICKPKMEDGKVIELLGVLQNITDRKKTEEDAKLSYEQIQLALRSLKMGLWDWDCDKNVLYWDDTIYSIMGVDKHKTRISFELFDSLIFEEDKPEVLKAINASVESGSLYEINYRIRTPAGEVKHIAARGKILQRDGGQWFTGITWDISEEVALHETLKIQEAKIASSARLSSLGEMAGAIAHEINNPLAIIQAKADSLKRRMAANPNDLAVIREGLDKIEETCGRIVKIIKGLNTFSRSSENDPFNPVAVEEILGDALSLISQKLALNSVQIRINTEKGVSVMGRASQLGQVFMNLLNNAYDAVEKQTDKWIKVDIKTVGDKAVIRITDSGPGIPPAVSAKLFQPFFTTKDIGKGTGLGLSISKGIIEEHKGTLALDVENPHTSFVIELPIATDV